MTVNAIFGKQVFLSLYIYSESLCHAFVGICATTEKWGLIEHFLQCPSCKVRNVSDVG